MNYNNEYIQLLNNYRSRIAIDIKSILNKMRNSIYLEWDSKKQIDEILKNLTNSKGKKLIRELIFTLNKRYDESHNQELALMIVHLEIIAEKL